MRLHRQGTTIADLISYKQVSSIVGDILFQHSRRFMLEKMNDNGWDKTWTWLFDAFPFLPESGGGSIDMREA